MSRYLLSLWFGGSLLACTLAAGCSQRHCTSTATLKTQVVQKKPADAVPAEAPRAAVNPEPQTGTVSPYRHVASPPGLQMPAVVVSQQALPPAGVQAPTPPGPQLAKIITGPVDLQPPRVPYLPAAAPVSPNTKRALPEPVGPPEDRVPNRRGFRDITAHPAFAHDKEYRWLVGILEKGPDGGLSVRYASVDEEDTHGGRLVLTSSQRLSTFRPGELVLIEGQVITPAAGNSPSTYRVQGIQRLQD